MRSWPFSLALLLSGTLTPVTMAQTRHGNQFVLESDILTSFNTKFDDALWGLTTYANVPYVPCLSKHQHNVYDIAILGAPFDTVRTITRSQPASKTKI